MGRGDSTGAPDVIIPRNSGFMGAAARKRKYEYFKVVDLPPESKRVHHRAHRDQSPPWAPQQRRPHDRHVSPPPQRGNGMRGPLPPQMPPPQRLRHVPPVPPPSLARQAPHQIVMPPARFPASNTPASEQNPLVWVTLPSSSQLVQDGYPSKTAALVYDPSFAHALGDAQEILKDMVGSLEDADVAVDHDADWTVFPEIGAALDKAGIGKAFCVATCALYGKWGIGVGGKKAQQRQNCAIMALCMVLAEDPAANREALRKWPDFNALRLELSAVQDKSRFVRGMPHPHPPTMPPPMATAQQLMRKKLLQATPMATKPPPVDSSPKKKKKQEVSGAIPALKWISLEELPDEILEYPDSAPAVGDDVDRRQLIGSAGSMLSELVDSVGDDITFIDDPHWKLFPALGAELKANGFPEYSLCIAKSQKHLKWAVGVAGQWKRRENAAKLSLCVAIVQDHEQSATFFARWPDLHKFCRSSPPPEGIATSRDIPDMTDCARESESEHEDVDSAAPDVAKPTPAKEAAGPATLPRDTPVWIEIPVDEIIPDPLLGMSSQALALSTDGSQRKSLYSRADEILKLILGEDDIKEVEYHDDVDWTKLPAVGAACKSLAEAEECFTVAACPPRGVWALGVSMKGQFRYKACKVALAASVLQKAIEDDDADLPDITEYTTFAEFFEEVKQTERPPEAE